MKYPEFPDYNEMIERFTSLAQLKLEYGSDKQKIEAIIADSIKSIERQMESLKLLPDDEDLKKNEPDDLAVIKTLRPNGKRKLWKDFDEEIYRNKLEGALIGRMAGCTLGAPVEFWDIDKMNNLAKETGMKFPPIKYWSYVPDPYAKRYQMSMREAYTSEKMDGVPVDDDIIYTILGLLIAEDYGTNFTTADIGKGWLKYLPYACTAEHVTLENLKKGIDSSATGSTENPFCEWIGAFIRSDPWGYLAPAWPEKAAEIAYRDAFLSHRRQGVYGEMFFAAVISAAFSVKDLNEIFEIGLSEIPENCTFAKEIRWAIDEAPQIKNYLQARRAADKRYNGMAKAHTINNAALVIWGLLLGEYDYTKTIGEIVAMGMDNDCTAATAGSILGAILEKKNIPVHWYEKFNDKIYTYLKNVPQVSITDIIKRFSIQAKAQYI
jgi:ADP-ribosylglycohydrolase